MRKIILLMSIFFVFISCSSDDDSGDIVISDTIFDKLISETSWSFGYNEDLLSYMQFFDVEDNKEKMKWYSYTEWADCYSPGFGYEHPEDEANSVMTVLENSNTAFVLERDVYGDGVFFFKTSFFEENGEMIFEKGLSGADDPFQQIMSPSNIIIDTDLMICTD